MLDPRGNENFTIDISDGGLRTLSQRFVGRGGLNLQELLAQKSIGRSALVSSFGAESVVLLHKVLTVASNIDVVFVDTGMHFPETISYVELLRSRLPIRNLFVLKPDSSLIAEYDPDQRLHLSDPDLCCTVRKSFSLQNALLRYDSWISGRKRYHGGDRSSLPIFERDGRHLKINPLALETAETLNDYMMEHDLPVHPLVSSGYSSIGCYCCSSRTVDGEHPRAGRWRGMGKTECGIHRSL